MKTARFCLALFLAAGLLHTFKVPVEGPLGPPLRETSCDPTYRLEYQIRGSAVSRLLLFIPFRVYYGGSASVDLTAHPRPDGSTRFVYAGLPGAAYIMRTLGFGGKTLALLTVSEDPFDVGPFADDLLSRWRKEAPEFAEKAKTIKKFPHRLLVTSSQPFAFERDASGLYRDLSVGLEPRYRYHPARTGIYFNVFPMLAELLKMLNHRFLPPPERGNGPPAPLPAEWTSEGIDFSADLNRAAALLEKVVKSLVTVKQKFPFRLRFRVVSSNAEEIAICGECFPDVPIWKGFMIREVFRRVRLRPTDRSLLGDEIWVGIRNSKGQGGFGHLRLERLDTKEESQ